MKVRLAIIQRCIQQGSFDEQSRHQLITVKNDWVGMKNRVDGYLAEINEILGQTAETLAPLRRSLRSGRAPGAGVRAVSCWQGWGLSRAKVRVTVNRRL